MVKIRFNMDGFAQIRTDPALVNLVDSCCKQVADRAGKGFEYRTAVMGRSRGKRYRGIVFTATPRAMYVNARDNTLLKALGGSR